MHGYMQFRQGKSSHSIKRLWYLRFALSSASLSNLTALALASLTGNVSSSDCCCLDCVFQKASTRLILSVSDISSSSACTAAAQVMNRDVLTQRCDLWHVQLASRWLLQFDVASAPFGQTEACNPCIGSEFEEGEAGSYTSRTSAESRRHARSMVTQPCACWSAVCKVSWSSTASPWQLAGHT